MLVFVSPVSICFTDPSRTARHECRSVFVAQALDLNRFDSGSDRFLAPRRLLILVGVLVVVLERYGELRRIVLVVVGGGVRDALVAPIFRPGVFAALRGQEPRPAGGVDVGLLDRERRDPPDRLRRFRPRMRGREDPPLRCVLAVLALGRPRGLELICPDRTLVCVLAESSKLLVRRQSDGSVSMCEKAEELNCV